MTITEAKAFNLGRLVRDVLLSSSELDTAALVKEILAEIDPRDYRTALEQALPRVLSNRRGTATFVLGGGVEGTAPGIGPSRKLTGYRRLDTILQSRIEIEPGRTVFFGELDIDGLKKLADLRRKVAKQFEVVAERCDYLAALLEKRKVEHVRDLSEIEILEAFK